ncbi:phosphatidylserine/phosphatidylglycerophosphate/cardiolipin synthase family protein [Dactylosporangium sp. NPDC050688]|uniref:phospholipase D-like domain-containing protein n=1 Tax=Dactylosporangium sp. NPDC050688 TaxID=3157217 RepID=UPI0033C8C478
MTYSGGGSTTRADVLDLIDGAREKVFVASYFIGDEDLREALCRAAARLRGGVYVISAMTERDLERAINEVGEHRQVDEKIERKRFEELTRHGIAVRAYEGCHAKFVVVDDRRALVSSANLTTDGLDITGENGVVIDDPADAAAVARLFATLWHGANYEVAMTGVPDVRRRTAAGPPVTLPEPATETGPIWTLHQQHHILDTIHSVIASAETSLVLATFSLDGLTGRPDLLVDPLRAAIDRAVDVRLLLRGRNNIQRHVTDAATLHELGVRLYPCRRNHAKGVIADGRRGALFSANFDATHGLVSDVELGMRLDGTAALAEALRYFEHAIAERDLDYVVDPPAALLAEHLHAHQLRRWPLGAELTLTGPPPELTTGPVLFTGSKDRLTLYAGRRSWNLVPDGDAYRLKPAEASRRSASERLSSWLTDRGDPPEPRGICPARLVAAGDPENRIAGIRRFDSLD